MRIKKKPLFGTLLAVGALSIAACAPSGEASGESEEGGSVEVGIITSQSGPLAAYGQSYLDGFNAGLDYATDGTGKVNGTTINVRIGDGAASADKAVQLAKQYIGDGVQILAGTVSSGVALSMAEQAEQNKILYVSGPAAADAITGINKYTFRSGRQTIQDVKTAGTFLDDIKGKKIVVFAQDNAFGQGNAAAVKAILGADGAGANVEQLLVSEDVKEFTSFAQQVLDRKPDLVFVAWAGATTGSMWESLEQQGVFDAAPVVTGLGNIASYGAYGDVAENISFLSYYFAAAPDNPVNDAMVKAVEAAGAEADLFTPDGFVAAQLIVHAIAEGDGDVDKMIAALEGYSFDGPKGKTTVRASDHAMLQPMYQARLVAEGDTFVPELIETVPAAEVAPPEAS